MESIKSKEHVSRPTAQQAERPEHVPPEHMLCAFYPAELHPDNDAAEGGFKLGPMVCPHGYEATGAFYSEDYIWALRTQMHHLINELEHLTHPSSRHTIQDIKKMDSGNENYIGDRFFLGPIEREDVYDLRSTNEQLKELTK